MSGVPFHLTRMGRHFIEETMPALVRELARLNANVERALATLDSLLQAPGKRTGATSAKRRR